MLKYIGVWCVLKHIGAGVCQSIWVLVCAKVYWCWCVWRVLKYTGADVLKYIGA